MTDMARQLLDELMNQYQASSKDFRDSDVCKDYLVSFCPHLLFTNTKADLGSCDLLHDDKLVSDYKASPDYMRLGYEESFYNKLRNLLSDLDRKIRRAFQRVSTEADEKVTNPDKEENQEAVILIEQKIKTLLENIEKAGEEGRIQEAKSLTSDLDKLKIELKAAQEKANAVNPMFKNEKRLEVCDVCGAFLVPDDDTRRLDAHIEGKQHQGYLKIREALAEYKSKNSSADNSSRRSSRDRSPYSRRRRERSRSRDRDGDRDRSSSRSYNKYRDQPRYRSRDRYNR
ncbi:Luc7-like protein 3 [Smittium mucronatum]|uniref:Luc7-like protein 3 n=1 Tax=Smittium mucronatum TaxID=133383 RepID=A0A1R0GMA9_9FUNG|nr:Luc7-like protein 3 [Smittium mucronatum]